MYEYLGTCPARLERWLDHFGAMCSWAWRALYAVGLRFNSTRGPGKAHPASAYVKVIMWK